MRSITQIRLGRGLRNVVGGLVLAAVSAVGAGAQSLIRDAEMEHTLKMLTTPVFRGGGVDPDTVNLYVIGDRSLNAFVAGGRNIFLNTGMLTRLDRPAQIQAVVAHELGHINGGHLARRGIQMSDARSTMAIGALLALAAAVAGGGGAAAALMSGTETALTRSYLQYSRGEESSADQAALTYLERAKIDPSGMSDVLNIFRGQEALMGRNLDPYVQTHPLGVDRILLTERRIEASPLNGKGDSPDMVYWTERMRAKLDGFMNRPETVLMQIRTEPETEFTLIRKAVALHRRPDPDGALAAMDKLLAMRPNDPYYLELKGQILLESGRFKEAVPFYRQAAKLAPREPLIAAGLAHALLALNTPATDTEALGLLRSATRDDRANSMALRDLALVHARRGEEGEAALATAERYALAASYRDVARHARRATDLLPNGSPGWLKAQDLLIMAERLEKKRD